MVEVIIRNRYCETFLNNIAFQNACYVCLSVHYYDVCANGTKKSRFPETLCSTFVVYGSA